MPRILARSTCLGLVPLVLGQAVLIVGCGGSNGPDAAAPPKNRMEGLQRIQQANIDHDKEAPANKRSGATKKR